MLNIEESLSVGRTLYPPHRGSMLRGSILYLKLNQNLIKKNPQNQKPNPKKPHMILETLIFVYSSLDMETVSPNLADVLFMNQISRVTNLHCQR